MKVSDAVAQWLAEHGIKHVFCVSGGAILHLCDSIAARQDISVIPMQNEQGAAFAADAYARLTGFGCAIATSGPGATNLLTGIAASYYDSVPVLFITGNQTTERLAIKGVRQYGFQATPIIEVARPICKGCFQVKEEAKALLTLSAARALALQGRKGPVLVDIPDDVQRCSL